MTGKQFRAALKAADMRQKAIAEKLGVSPITVNRWCSGELKVPRYAVAYLELLRLVRELDGCHAIADQR